MTTRNDRARHVAVVGGGIIGLSSAWRLARAGLNVTLYERDEPGLASSRVAAGMLAPVSETQFEELEMVALGRDSIERYPSFLAELREDSDVEVLFDITGTLHVAMHRDDVATLRRMHQFRERAGLPGEWLSGAEAREREPMLSSRVNAAAWIPGDGYVDNQAMLRALEAACRARGVDLRPRSPVHAVAAEQGRACGVRIAAGVEEADTVVIAAGAWSAGIDGIPPADVPPVRPIKGQAAVLRAGEAPGLGHVVRAPRAYVTPKPDGRVLVGATQEEMGFDDSPMVGPLIELLAHAWEAVPSLYEYALERVDVGLRPGSRDHRPIVGAGGLEGLVMATGHYRHGILLAPVTADAVCAGIVEGAFPENVAPLSPKRFQKGYRDGTQG